MKIIVLGPPGSGKSTQCRHVSEEYNIGHINTGDILRKNESRTTEKGEIGEIMDRGELVPKPIVNNLIMDAIKESEDYILDGYPRTRSQAELLSDNQDIDLIIHLEIPLKVATERIQNRLICKDCNSIYNTTTKPPSHTGRCDRCGATLKQRDDDNGRSAETRIENYASQTDKVVQYFSESEIYTSIDAKQDEYKVFERMCDVIDETMAG